MRLHREQFRSRSGNESFGHRAAPACRGRHCRQDHTPRGPAAGVRVEGDDQFLKLIRDVINDPFIPVSWGKNQKGMQAGEEVNTQVWIRENSLVDRIIRLVPKS